MKFKSLLILLAVAVIMMALPGTSHASDPEFIYMCRPCSREFIPQAEDVIKELGLEEAVRIRTTGCLGACDETYVLEFRDVLYTSMDAEKLRLMLMDAFDK